MNEDYLWDRTGKADEEIEELEQVLGKLKYQPRQLEIPVGATVGPKSWALRGLAIAATIAILLLGAGLWRSRQVTPAIQAGKTTTESAPDQSIRSEVLGSTAARSGEEATPASGHTATFRSAKRSRFSTVTASANRARLVRQGEQKLPANELAEAQAAKQQLLLALRVASAKLTVAQKRTQSANPANQIQNQHKIG